MTQTDPAAHALLLETLSETALTLCDEKSWAEISLAELCRKAGLSLVSCAEAGLNRYEIAAHLDQKLDHAMLDSVTGLEAEAPLHDRLFDALMVRFDTMQDRRAAWVSILQADQDEPTAALARTARRVRTAAWALEAVGIITTNVKTCVRSIGLARRLRQVETLWLTDDADLSKTMAGLDQTLRQSQEWVARGDKFSDFLTSYFKAGMRRGWTKAATAHSPEDPLN